MPKICLAIALTLSALIETLAGYEYVASANQCTKHSPATGASLDDISGVSFVRYWSEVPAYCAFFDVQQSANGDYYQGGYSFYLDQSQSNRQTSPSVVFVENPDMAGQFVTYTDTAPNPQSAGVIVAEVEGKGYAWVICNIGFPKMKMRGLVALISGSENDAQVADSLRAQLLAVMGNDTVLSQVGRCRNDTSI